MSTSFLKKLAALTATLIAIWVAYLYQQVPHRHSPFSEATDSAMQILLEQGPHHVQLSKQSGKWMVKLDSGTFVLADEEGAKRLESDLKNVQLEDVISERADRAGEYEVDTTSGTHVVLRDARELMLAEGIFGKLAADADHIYFRYPDKPNVYLARGIYRGELGRVTPDDWHRRPSDITPGIQTHKVKR